MRCDPPETGRGEAEEIREEDEDEEAEGGGGGGVWPRNKNPVSFFVFCF